jgi:predicted enzyme related to lactoylglutathione lyase
MGHDPGASEKPGCGRMLAMSLEWEHAVIDARDPVALGRWWAEALGWAIVNEDPEDFEIRESEDRLPGIIFEPVGEAKQQKNRLHLDFRPRDQEAEVQRLLALGASHVDVGQRDVSWVVLADPEGNEFCVLEARHATT